MNVHTQPISRRNFLYRVAGAGAAGLAFPYIAPSSWASNGGPALRVAQIGVGGIGGRHAQHNERFGVDCPCFAEVDTRRTGNVLDRFPDARGYQDYRKMFEEMANEFDAVVVATPDHHHFPATMLALMHDKPCLTEKPLAHTIAEARMLAQTAASKKLATQMGNQGHANRGNRLTYSWVKSGMIGDLVEAHCWTNRPVWPQPVERPTGAQPVPAELDWDVWIGPAPFRPFNHDPCDDRGGVYHPFNWRSWWDFGGGAMGDMACHTMDDVYWILHPRQPTSFQLVQTSGFNGDSYPAAAKIRLNFPSDNGGSDVPVYWYSGGLKPDRPDELEEDRDLPRSGTLLIGTRATILSTGDYGESPRIIPESKMQEIGLPELLIEESPGYKQEWLMACRGERNWDFPKSNFSYAGPFTEATNVGVLAHHLEEGETAKWDSANLQVTDREDLNQFVKKTYRSGWDYTV